MNEATRRVLRTGLQMVAAGGLTALVEQVARDVPGTWTPYVFIAGTLVVTFCQNLAEANGWMPVVLPAKRDGGN